MIIPLWYLLAPYVVILLVAALFFIFNIFHIVKFGIGIVRSTLVTMLYIAFFGGTTIFTIQLLLRLDWTQTIEVGSIFTTIPTL